MPQTQEKLFPERYHFDIVHFIDALPDDTEEIDIQWSNLTYLPPLSKFRCLKRLNVSNNFLTALPHLPDTIETLNCESNLLKSLPRLPSHLRKLVCDGNQLTCLPPLNPCLNVLYCTHNMLESLPEFNRKLLKVRAYCNNIRRLPAQFNQSLKELDVSANKVEYLPTALNDHLEKLYCSHNNIYELPKLNARLKILHCNFNLLRVLPDDLKNVVELNCNENEIQRIPPLHRVQRISCANNKIAELAPLSPLITKINIIHNPIANYILWPKPKSVEEIRKRVETIHRFKYLFYCVKLRSKFRKWRENAGSELIVLLPSSPCPKIEPSLFQNPERQKYTTNTLY